MSWIRERIRENTNARPEVDTKWPSSWSKSSSTVSGCWALFSVGWHLFRCLPQALHGLQSLVQNHETLCLPCVAGPPVIESFTFPRFMEEGSRAKVLCSVIKGDPPITIRWLKDSRLLTSSALNAVSISTLDEFSSAIVISKVSLAHRGNYTCIASNAAASSNYTAQALVYGELRAEPRSLSVA